MAQLGELFATLEKDYPAATHSIAGYVAKRKFYYFASANEHLPAALALLDSYGKQKGLIYTNLPKAHWLYTYTGGGEEEQVLMHVSQASVSADTHDLLKGLNWPRGIAGGPVNDKGPLSGGLYAAAKGLVEKPTFHDKNVHTKEKGLHRALRYYMLAAYAALGKCANLSHSANFIAALMVDDSGRILSYGVNSGWFHHGEVNMLLNYFKTNPGRESFPENTIIFSTLTPCKQCSKYLQAARPAESVIFMGQKDTGPLGSEGEKYGKYLNAVTDPVRNRVTTPVYKQVAVGTREVKGAWGTPNRIETIYKDEQVGINARHYQLEASLSQKMKPDESIAQQIGAECSQLLIESVSTLTHKFDKKRSMEERLDDQVKLPVLSYLNTWLTGIQLDYRTF